MAEELEQYQAKMAAKEEAEIEQKANKKTIMGGVSVLLQDGDDFLQKWSGPMLLGPLVPAIYCAFVCTSGAIVLTLEEGLCNFPLDVFLQAVMVVCYLFLLVFSWIWLGDELRFVIESLNISWVILAPFRSMKFLMLYYVILYFTSMILMAVGTQILSLAFLCIDSTPQMYSYVSFVLAIYWIMFVVITVSIIKLAFGSSIAKFVKDKTAAPSQNELEERIFRKKFQEFDYEKDNTIRAQDFPALLQGLGIYVPDEEQPALLRTLDPDKTGTIMFDNMFTWFIKMNGDAGDGDDIDDGEDEAFDDFATKKGR